MTTIAIDGKTIAADGLACVDRIIVANDFVKIRRIGGLIYSLAGDQPIFGPLIEWHQSGADPKKVPKAGTDLRWEFLILYGGQVERYTDNCPYPSSMTIPRAFGSGEDFANGALASGKTAREAVEIASRFDVYTGGKITEMPIEDQAQIAAE